MRTGCRPRSAALAALLLVAMTADASAHGGQFRKPGAVAPPGLSAPTDASNSGGWWDSNVDALVGDVVGPVTTGDAEDAARARRAFREDRVVPFLRSVVDGKQGNDPDLISAALLALAKTTTSPADIDRLFAAGETVSPSALIAEAAALAPGLLRRSDPTLRFDARILDRARARLLDVADGIGIHKTASRRVRCFAILALGLLGDQPTVLGQPSATVNVPDALLVRLGDAGDDETLYAILTALGLQAPATVPRSTLAALRELAAAGTFASKARHPHVQATAVVAYARLAGIDSVGVTLGLMRAPRLRPELRHAAIVALGLVAPKLDAVARTAAAAELGVHAEEGNPETAGLALLTIGRFLSAAMGDPADRTTFASAAATTLVRRIAEGGGSPRRVAALAAGLALRTEPAPGPNVMRTAFRQRAVHALAVLSDDEGVDPVLRSIALICLGLARDEASIPRMSAMLASRDVDIGMRASAATALGLLGDRGPAALAALRVGVDARSPELVRREAARSLGILGDASAVPLLLADMRGNLPDSIRARAAVGLGALRRLSAVQPLIDLASDKNVGDLARAIAVAALGLLADPERVRSLSLLASDLGSTGSDAIPQALSLL